MQVGDVEGMRWLAAALVAAALGACTAPPTDTPSPSAPPSPTSMDTLLIAKKTGASGQASINTQVTLTEQKCWISGYRSLPILWPEGTRWTDASRTSLVLPNGQVVVSGDWIDGGGTTAERRTLDEAPSDSPCFIVDENGFTGWESLDSVELGTDPKQAT